jgi:EAL domain-containing protein (putative c-di-GMP-specific phosphodiesterase class I)
VLAGLEALARSQHPDKGIIMPDSFVPVAEETGLIDPILSLDLMTPIRMKGLQLSIDDFGPGYSSMVQLVRLPFSEIKIDKSFVMFAKRTKEPLNVIKSIVDLRHSLGLRVTAEGGDDLSTLNYVNTLGCDLAQGYFIARPMWGDAARSWAERSASQ